MPLMDEFQEERDKMKDAPLKAKWKYFVDYYLVKTLIIAAVAALVIGIAVTMLLKKDVVLYVALIDFSDLGYSESEIEQPFTRLYVANPRREEIILDAAMLSDASRAESSEPEAYGVSYEDEMRLSMLMATDVDLLLSGEEVVDKYGKNDFLKTLTEVYSAAELQEFDDAGRLKYINGVAYAVRMNDDSFLKMNYAFLGPGKDKAEIYIAFPPGGHIEMALQFLDFLEKHGQVPGASPQAD